jgi:hypothetical protein
MAIFRQLRPRASSSLNGRMISVSDEAIRSQPDFRCPSDCRLFDVVVAGSASSSHLCGNCVRDARSNFDLEMVPSESAEMIRRECNGDVTTVIPVGL